MTNLPILVQRDNHIIYGEFLDFGVVVHGYVRPGSWSPSLKRQITEDLQVLASAFTFPVFAFQRNPDQKWLRFIKLVGGIPDITRNTGDGEPVEMFRFPPLD